MLAILGWWKKVRPYGKKLFRICQNPENDLVEIIKSRKFATYTKCKLDAHSIVKLLNILSYMLAVGKMESAANFCRMIADKCFGETPDNPHRLVFLTIAMLAECEDSFYDMGFFRVCAAHDLPLKIRYSLCQQSATGFLEMEPTIFKISGLLTICEEFSHFSCFRQCHVNLFKNLAEIGEDENVDWFDRVKVLDSNILALINDSDLSTRLCHNENDKKTLLFEDGQYCFSWFNHLHFREIYVRGTAAVEVLKQEEAYANFVKEQPVPQTKTKKIRRRLQPQNPLAEEEQKAKRISFGEDSGVLADSNVQLLRKQSKEKLRLRRRLVAPENVFISDVEDFNYSAPFADGKTFSTLNAERIKDIAYYRKERERHYDGGGKFPIDPRKRMPGQIRRKIRMISRKIMSEAREMQRAPVIDDEMMNKAFPVSDDECSDNEAAPKTFFRTETLESLKKKNSRKFGVLNPDKGVKKVVWWQNAKDELLTARAVANHCVKITGESSEPFCEYEEYLGKLESGGKSRDRISESRREVNCRAFDLQKETNSNDGALLTMPAMDPFKDLITNRRPTWRGTGSLTLQNMRRRCIDELLIVLMIIKGQQQLQDGNVIRCVAYLMLIEFKFAVIAEKTPNPYVNRKNNFDPYLKHLYKCLLAKFRLYSTDLFGQKSLNDSEELLLESDTEKFDLNKKCEDFYKDTGAQFFCICVRGRMISLDILKEITKLDREEIERQHEFFFGLDNANKNTHLNSFWRTEISPIISGLVYTAHHSFVQNIDKYSPLEVEKFLNGIKGISPQSREWFKLVTKKGFMVQQTKGADPKYSDERKCVVPILFQIPKREEDTLFLDNLEPVHKAVTSFVREKNERWKVACKADKENFRKTNKDCEYRLGDDMTFFGQSIEKDVYMVAVYKGEMSSEQKPGISARMESLARELRSQAGFIAIKQIVLKK